MGTPLRVLVVEDSEDDVLLLLRELRRSGYEPTCERVDTATAMKLALDRQSWDIVIADYSLPRFSGLDALALVKGRGLDLPFILVSGTIGEETAVAAMKAGAHDYILKGNLVRLGAAVERELREAEIRRERRRAEEVLARTNAQLREALQAKDEMIANVSHELRTPLTHIMGYSELLSAGVFGGHLNADELHAVEVIWTQSQRLARLVNSLLALQTWSVEQLVWERVDLQELASATIALWQETARQKGIALRLQSTPGKAMVQGDTHMLQQALDQLLENACKFTPQGGSVTVRLEQQGDEVWLSVSDTGIGIPPDKLSRVFERFYQVDGSSTRRYGGVGIGLSLAQRVIELHGGRIWAESAGEGRGTTVHIALPYAVMENPSSEN